MTTRKARAKAEAPATKEADPCGMTARKTNANARATALVVRAVVYFRRS
jgi:hypothetical protein